VRRNANHRLLERKLTDGSGIELMELVGGKFEPDVFSPAVATRKTMGGVLK
jgi:hypothetical protein